VNEYEYQFTGFTGSFVGVMRKFLSALALLIWCQEEHPACRKSCYDIVPSFAVDHLASWNLGWWNRNCERSDSEWL